MLCVQQVSVRIVCRTGPVDREMQSPIQVGNAVGYTNSSVRYGYKVRKQKLQNMSPRPQDSNHVFSVMFIAC